MLDQLIPKKIAPDYFEMGYRFLTPDTVVCTSCEQYVRNSYEGMITHTSNCKRITSNDIKMTPWCELIDNLSRLKPPNSGKIGTV